MSVLANSHARLVGLAVLCCLALAGPGSTQARAAAASPQWTVTSVSLPTNFAPASKLGEDKYVATVVNTGGAATDGSTVTVQDELPAGLVLSPSNEASGEDELAAADGEPPSGKIQCVLTACTYSGRVVPDQTLRFVFPVEVRDPEAGTVSNVVRVHGGGAPDAAVTTPTKISAESAPFGAAPGGEATALSSTQAGAHPDITVGLAFNTVNDIGSLAGDAKDTVYDLPPGFAGDLVDTTACPDALFILNECPTASQVGVTLVTLTNGVNITKYQLLEPVYDLSPNPGEIAKLGFSVLGGNFDVEGGVSLRPDYGLRTTFRNIIQGPTELVYDELTLWGVPTDPIHDPLRWEHESANGGGKFGAPAGGKREVPFFTNPTSCDKVPLQAQFRVDSWENPEPSGTPTGAAPIEMPFGPIVGCDRLLMEPSVAAEVSTDSASSATGFSLATTIPQTYGNAEGLATSTLKKEVVTLPEGMTVNPSSGAGLAACSEAQYAEEGAEYVSGRGCPNESRLATVKIVTPSLKEEATGSVFIATPAPRGEAARNPFDSLLAVYLVARIPNRGVLIKAPGKIEANPLTGQLTTTFDDLPPLPFSTATFAFNQGANAPLVTPPVCGSYTVTAALSPWSEPTELISPLVPPFSISSGVGGGSCPTDGTPPFKPKVIAGTNDNTAGSYSPFYLRIVRDDGEQEITRFSSQFPPGLTARLSAIPSCSDAKILQAREKSGAQEQAEPSCPAASQIGHTLVGAGVGSVLAWTSGRVYFAGPYHGAPFSIVAITSATVGPFDLGTVVVREALDINSVTAAVTVDASASDPIPHIIDGIVVHVRDIRVYIDRPNFMLNPTSCDHMSISNTITGAGGNPSNPADQTPVTVSTPFQAADCANLKFKPDFKVFTSGRTSRRMGASLHIVLSFPNAPQGTQANIHSVKVELPKRLPSRLETLKKACLSAVFNANPAACPPDSRVGVAKAITPILPVPLQGPAYFVSYGGAKFPELIVVLQGYGITIDLHGETSINEKTGVTSSKFRSVPDQPVERFELTLPEGPYSALTANGSLCKITRKTTIRKRVTRRIKGRLVHVIRTVKRRMPGTLRMPIVFTAQNGAVIRRSTPITVLGCTGRGHKHTKRKRGTHHRRGL